MAENTSHTGAPGNPVNDALSKAASHFSRFQIERNRFQTMHFGLIEPHAVMEGVSTDVLPFSSFHDLRSYTLSNILMSNIKMHKEYFNVNYDAILPKHWQKVYSNPTYGDDVLPDVNTVIPYESFFADLRTVWLNCVAYMVDDDPETVVSAESFSIFLRNILFLEMFLSSGSLLRTLGVGFVDVWTGILPDYLPEVAYNSANFIDWFVDQVCSVLSTQDWKLMLYKSSGSSDLEVDDIYFVRSGISRRVGNVITMRDALMIMRERPNYVLVHQSVSGGDFIDDDGYNFAELLSEVFGSVISVDITTDIPDEVLNYSRIVAYQLVCAHYFTNDHVDYVYSAELFEQAEASLYQYALSEFNDSQHYFNYNGLDCYYDTFSGKIVSYLLHRFVLNSASNVQPNSGVYSALSFLTNLFTFRRSLRYRDYFLGSKPTPLALGDTDVRVNSNLVSIIDTTKAIATQRFLNQVNRIGRRIKDYIVGLFPGARVEKDIHEPTWLMRTDHDVKAINNENTASEQYELESSVTSTLHSSDSRYVFELEIGRPGIVLGVTYFDVRRAYPYSVDRQTLAADRFDMFVPQMQFIGDQPISNVELGHLNGLPFGYTLRDMQWKQSFDIAVGGFVDALPGWCFLSPVLQEDAHISPDVIRSYPGEIDSYYLSLTGWSLATYFHFILLIGNKVDAKRPMVYAPSIL